jgi:hypothetical protein
VRLLVKLIDNKSEEMRMLHGEAKKRKAVKEDVW